MLLLFSLLSFKVSLYRSKSGFGMGLSEFASAPLDNVLYNIHTLPLLSPQRATLARSRSAPHKSNTDGTTESQNGHHPPRLKMVASAASYSAGYSSQEVSAGSPKSYLHKRKYPSSTEEDRTPNCNEEQLGGGGLQWLRRRKAQPTGRTEVGWRRKAPKAIRRSRDRKNRSEQAAESAEAAGRPRSLWTSASKTHLPRKLSLHRYPVAERTAAASSFHLNVAS